MLTQTIPSYAYQEYADDSDIQAFIAAYNEAAQTYVTWFATANIPIYTQQSGPLLDWIALGMYGIQRPTLDNSAVSDDVFKRCITWAFYKGDGKIFDIRWLKRRIMRFLNGVNGTDPGVNQTYQISVTFGAPNIVYIDILPGIAQIAGGAIFNASSFRLNMMQLNELDLTIQQYTDLTFALIFQEAVNARVLELPFQYTYVVTVNS